MQGTCIPGSMAVARGFVHEPVHVTVVQLALIHNKGMCELSVYTAKLSHNVKKKIAILKYKLTKVPQPIVLVVRITLLVAFLKTIRKYNLLGN